MLKNLDEFHKFVSDKIEKPKAAQMEPLMAMLNIAQAKNREAINRRLRK